MAWPPKLPVNVSGRMRNALIERSERITESGCWIWTGAVDLRGRYGLIRVDGKTCRTHRVAYEEFVGKVPDGMCVLHSCDVPTCINPAHLWLGTQDDNIADMVRKRRQRGAIGSRNSNAKLTEEIVREIRESPESGGAIAARLGISKSTVCRARAGTRWSHI